MIANLSLDETNQLDGIWYYRLGSMLKLGIAPQYKFVKSTSTMTVLGTTAQSGTQKEHELSLGLYTGLDLIDNDDLYVEISNILGGVYSTVEVEEDVDLTGYGVRIAPSFELFFKLKKKFHLGFGFRGDFVFVKGDLKGQGSGSIDMTGHAIEAKFDLLKMKILF